MKQTMKENNKKILIEILPWALIVFSSLFFLLTFQFQLFDLSFGLVGLNFGFLLGVIILSILGIIGSLVTRDKLLKQHIGPTAYLKKANPYVISCIFLIIGFSLFGTFSFVYSYKSSPKFYETMYQPSINDTFFKTEVGNISYLQCRSLNFGSYIVENDVLECNISVNYITNNKYYLDRVEVSIKNEDGNIITFDNRTCFYGTCYFNINTNRGLFEEAIFYFSDKENKEHPSSFLYYFFTDKVYTREMYNEIEKQKSLWFFGLLSVMFITVPIFVKTLKELIETKN